MAAGKPVLAFLNKESDAFELVVKTNCGFAVTAGNIEAAENVVRKLAGMSSEELSAMGQRGREYAESNLSLGSAVDKIKRLLSRE